MTGVRARLMMRNSARNLSPSTAEYPASTARSSDGERIHERPHDSDRSSDRESDPRDDHDGEGPRGSVSVQTRNVEPEQRAEDEEIRIGSEEHNRRQSCRHQRAERGEDFASAQLVPFVVMEWAGNSTSSKGIRLRIHQSRCLPVLRPSTHESCRFEISDLFAPFRRAARQTQHVMSNALPLCGRLIPSPLIFRKEHPHDRQCRWPHPHPDREPQGGP